MGIIGIILGGMAGGGRNPGLDMINKRINDDIESQKLEIQSKQHRAEGMHTLLAEKMKQFGDEGAAEVAARAQRYEQFKMQLQSEALRSGSPILQAKAKETIGQLQLEQAKLHQMLEHWQQTGVAGGLTDKDVQRAYEMYKGQLGLSPDQAKQAALALRGVAPTTGLPTLTKPGAGGKEEAATKQLQASASHPPSALSLGERIEAGASHLPLVGRAFQGTSGARKEVALEASNIPAYGYAHKVLGARTPEAQKEIVSALIVKPGDSETRIQQKFALRGLVQSGQMTEEDAAARLGAANDE